MQKRQMITLQVDGADALIKTSWVCLYLSILHLFCTFQNLKMIMYVYLVLNMRILSLNNMECFLSCNYMLLLVDITCECF